jgi:hypothetical protein
MLPLSAAHMFCSGEKVAECNICEIFLGAKMFNRRVNTLPKGEVRISVVP